MSRLEQIKEAETTREAAEVLLTLICEEKEDRCSHNCGECTKDVEKYLEES